MERSVQSILCTIFYAAVLTLSTVSSQSCTTVTLDPRNVNSYDPSRLVPLFRQHPETFSHSGEQWIFPDLRFTCSGILTQWIFAGVPGLDATPCRVELGTWRPDRFSTINNIYRQRSTTITERNLVPHVQDGKIFTYKLASPVPVEPGDIVGIELGRFCAPLEDLDNVLSHNISGTDSSYLSYRKDGSEPTFFLPSSFVIPEHDFVPLIEAVVEPLQEITGLVEIRTQSRDTTARPEADQPDAPSASTIASAIFGAIVGVLITVIVCVCVWCITRRVRIQVSFKKERETKSAANTNKPHQQNCQHHEEQQGESINVISMQQNEAYKRIQLTGTAEQTDNHTRAEWVPERAIQLNVAYGKRDEQCVEIEREETAGVPKQAVRMNPAYGKGHEVHVRIETEEIDDEYERMYAATTGHALLRQNARERENCSKRATPREYEVPVQRQGSHTFTQEDNEHQYDYINKRVHTEQKD